MNKDNIYYEKMYTKFIEPLYGKKRDNHYDEIILDTNNNVIADLFFIPTKIELINLLCNFGRCKKTGFII